MRRPDAADVRETVRTLERRVEILEAERDIRALLTRYSITADLRLASEWVDLWTDDGVYDLGEGNVSTYQGRFEGHHDLRRLITGPGMPPEGRSQHYTDGPLQLEIDGDEAVGEGYSVTFVEGDDGRARAWALGFNHWTFVRRDGGWRIRERRRRELGSTAVADVVGRLGR